MSPSPVAVLRCLVSCTATNPQTFEVSVFGQTFKGAGGAAIIWVLMTTIGIVAIGHYWVP